jgi:hypothetical protein
MILIALGIFLIGFWLGYVAGDWLGQREASERVSFRERRREAKRRGGL